MSQLTALIGSRQRDASFYLTSQAVQTTAQSLLKSEWEIVKRGEQTYKSVLKWAKGLAVTSLCVVALLFIAQLIIYLVHALPEPFKG